MRSELLQCHVLVGDAWPEDGASEGLLRGAGVRKSPSSGTCSTAFVRQMDVLARWCHTAAIDTIAAALRRNFLATQLWPLQLETRKEHPNRTMIRPADLLRKLLYNFRESAEKWGNILNATTHSFYGSLVSNFHFSSCGVSDQNWVISLLALFSGWLRDSCCSWKSSCSTSLLSRGVGPADLPERQLKKTI